MLRQTGVLVGLPYWSPVQLRTHLAMKLSANDPMGQVVMQSLLEFYAKSLGVWMGQCE